MKNLTAKAIKNTQVLKGGNDDEKITLNDLQKGQGQVK